MLEWQQQDSLLFSRALLFLFTQQLSSPVLYLTVPCLCVHVLGLHLYLYTLRSNAQRGFQINKINIGEKKKANFVFIVLDDGFCAFHVDAQRRDAAHQKRKKKKNFESFISRLVVDFLVRILHRLAFSAVWLAHVHPFFFLLLCSIQC